MSFGDIFKKLVGKKKASGVIDEELVRAIAEIVKRNQGHLMGWDKIFGILSFNIWHNSNQDFLQSNDVYDIEIPFLCSIGVFQNWDKVKLSQEFTKEKIIGLAPQQVLIEKEQLISQMPDIKSSLQELKSRRKIETIKPFVTIFLEGFLSSYQNKSSNVNPLEFFQAGIEVLFLFVHEIESSDSIFNKELSDYGEYADDVWDIIEQLNSL